MIKHFTWLLATAIALIALVAAAGAATAAEFEIRPAGEATAISLGLVTLAAGLNVICNLELLTRLNTGRIVKTAGNQFSTAKRVTISNETGRTTECNGGARLLILEEGGAPANPAIVNWPLVYNSILGTLPSNVTGVLIRINSTQFLLTTRILGSTVTCLWEGPIGALLPVTGTNPYTSGLIRILETDIIPRHTAALNSAACPANERLVGSFRLSPTQTITRF